MNNDSKNILIGITSSIAAYKTYELIRLFKKNGHNVKVVLSENALNFVSPLVIETLSKNKAYYSQFEKRTDVEHINLCDWADIFLIAPISANTISKCANGFADNLLTSVFCAFLGTGKPILASPAMNSNMWENPIIKENIKKLKSCGVEFVNPESGFLACGTEGCGRLANIEIIFEKTMRCLFQNKKNNSKKIVVTLGGTKELIDSVRCITNLSSGKMGQALLKWAYRFGYNTMAVSTFELQNKPYNVTTVNSAQEMSDVLKKEDFDILIMASAVCDFRPKEKFEKKLSKENIKENLTLELVKNPDVVKTISENKKENQIIAGFCLADDDLMECAQKKLINKKLDYIIANEIKTALNTDKNKVTIIEKSGKIINIELDTKENIARKILEVVCD